MGKLCLQVGMPLTLRAPVHVGWLDMGAGFMETMKKLKPSKSE